MKHKLLPLFSVYLDVVIFGCNQVEVETSQIEDEVNFTIDLPVESKAAIYDFLSTITNDIKDASTRSADKIYPIRGFFEPLKSCYFWSGRNCLPFDIIITPEENVAAGLLATRSSMDQIVLSKIERSWSLTDVRKELQTDGSVREINSKL